MENFRLKNFFVIIPAYNEGSRLGEVVRGVKKHTDNIIVIDDGSDDQTSEMAKRAGAAIVLRHKKNLGKGAALRTGCQAALKLNTSVIVFMDADGQHNPDDLPKLVEKLTKEKLDIVFGSRTLTKKEPFIRVWGNKILTCLARFFSGVRTKDVLSGFRAFSAEAYPKINWQSDDYAVEAEIVMNVGWHNLKYAEVTVETIYKDKYKGLNASDGLRILLRILKFKFQRQINQGDEK